MSQDPTPSIAPPLDTELPDDPAYLELEEAAKSDPGSDDAWDALEDWAADSQQPDPVSVVYRQVLATNLGAEVSGPLGQRAVGFHEEWYREDSPALLEVLTTVFERDMEEGAWAFERLTVTYTSGEQWDALLALYDRAIAGAGDEERRASLLEEAIQTAKDFADAPLAAARYMRGLSVLRPNDSALRAQLERILEKAEAWPELAGALAERIEGEPAEAARETRLRRVELLVDRIGDLSAAVTELEAYLGDDAADPAPAVGILERIAGDREVDDTIRRNAVSLLRQEYSESEQGTDVVRALDTALELAEGPEKVALHLEAADRLAAQGRMEDALGHCAAALEAAPGDENVHARYGAIAEQAGADREYAEALLKVADGVWDAPVRAGLRRAAAERLAGPVGDTAAGAAALIPVFEDEALEREARVADGYHLAALLRAGEDPKLLRHTLGQLAQLEAPGDGRRQLHAEVAALAKAAGDSAAAVAAWENILADDADDDEARESLLALLTEDEAWPALVMQLRARVERGGTDFAIRSDLVRIAELSADKLQDDEGAIATWRQVAERFGESADVVDALSALYERVGAHEPLADLLQRATDREGAHLADVRVRLGLVYARHLGRSAEALAAFRGALEGDPTREDARTGLKELGEQPELADEALDALARAVRQAGEWQPLLEMREARLGAARTVDAAVAIQREAARIYERDAEDAASAFICLADAFERTPADAGIESELARLAEAHGLVNERADALQRGGAATEDVHLRARLFKIEAGLRDGAGEPNEATFDAIRRAYVLARGDGGLAERLVAVGRALEQLAAAEAELAIALDEGVLAEPTVALLVEVRRELGHEGLYAALRALSALRRADLDALDEAVRVAADDAQRADATRALYDRATGLWGQGASATGEVTPEAASKAGLESLIAAHEAAGDARGVVARLLEGARLPVTQEEALAMRRRAAGIVHGELGDRAQAVDLYRAILDADPEDVAAMGSLGDLLAEEQRFAELLTLRQVELGKTEDAERKLALRLEIADLVGKVEALGGRVEALETNLEERPGHLPSIEALRQVLRAQRQYEHLADVLMRQGEAAAPEAAPALFSEVAELAEGPLGDAERAIAAHLRVAELAPSPGTFESLARLRAERGDHATQSRWLEKRLGVASEDERVGIALDLATSWSAAGRTDKHQSVLEEAYGWAPGDANVREPLIAAYRSGAQHGPLANLLVAAADYEPDAEKKLALVREAADLYETKLDSRADATQALARAVELAPDDRELRLRYAEALRASQAYDDARAQLDLLLEGFGRRRNAERAHVHALIGKVARAQGDLDTALDQVEKATKMAMTSAPMLLLLGQLAGEAGQVDRAEKAYRTLLVMLRRRSAGDEVDVGVGEVLAELAAIARGRGDEEKANELRASALDAVAGRDAEALRLAAIVDDEASASLAAEGLARRLETAGDEATPEVHAALAELYDGRLERPADALGHRLAALGLAPTDPALHDAALTSAAGQNAVAQYAETVSTAKAAFRREEDAPIHAFLASRLGAVHAGPLGAPETAVAFFEEAEEKGDAETRATARGELANLAEARGDLDAMQAVLARIVSDETVSEEARSDARYRTARAQLGAGQVDVAVSAVRSAFADDPQPKRASELLSMAFDAGARDEETVVFYDGVARGAQDLEVLLEYLVRRVQLEDATVPMAREAVDVALSVDADARLDGLYERAVQIAESGVDFAEARWALDALARRRKEAGDVPGALQWARRALDATPFEELRGARLAVAELASQEGGDKELAMETYRDVLSDNWGAVDAYDPLLTLLAEAEDEDGFIDVVSAVIDASESARERGDVRVRLARYLASREGREPDAVDVLRTALDDDPDHPEAGLLLTELFESCGYDEELVGLLEEQLEGAIARDDSDAVEEVALKLGVRLDKIRPEDAVEVFRRGVMHAPQSRPLIEGLIERLGDAIDPREKAELEERLLALETGDAASARAERLVEAWQALGDEQGIERALSLGYRGNPDDEIMRDRLERWYRQRERFAPLAAFLAAEAERLSAEPNLARERLFEAASIQRDTLGDPAEAARMLRAAAPEEGVDIAIVSEIVACLDAAAEHQSAVDELGVFLERAAEDAPERLALLRMRSRAQLTLGQIAGAVQDLEAGYARDPEQFGQDLSVGLMYARSDAEGRGEVEEQRRVSFRLIEVLKALGDAEQARDVLRGWIHASPTDLEALELLRDTDLATERWDGVAEATERMVPITEGEAQAQAALLLSDAHEALGDIGGARAGIEHAYTAQPDHPALVERIGKIYEAVGAHRELAEMLERQATTTEDPEARFEIYRRAGRLWNSAGDAEAAMGALARAMEVKPDDPETAIYLVDALIGAERFEEAETRIDHAITNHPRRRSPELSQLQHRKARLARAQGDRAGDLQWMAAALECDKNNMEVAAELAHLAMSMGELDLALNALRAVTLSRNDGPMSRAEAFLLQARIAHHRGEARRALLWARKAKQEDPELHEASEFLRELGDG